MELSAEKNFEKEKYQNYIQMNENTKEGTNTQSQKKSSFNIHEIKAYLEENNNLSNEYDPHLITDVNNNFSSRKELFLSESDNNEDLVMNQSYNYNPHLSNYSSKIESQNILQISQNKNENYEPNNNYIIHSEKKVPNQNLFAEITTKKSTKTTATKIDKENSIIDIYYDEGIKEEDICNTYHEEEENEIKKEKSEFIESDRDNQDNNNEKLKKSEQKNETNYSEYKKYEKNIIDNEDDEILEIKDDTFGKYVDNIIQRSYRVYKNRQCPSCANLLSKGKSCIKCPKYHHLIKTGK